MNLEWPKWNKVDPNVMQDEILSLESQPSQQLDPLDLGQYIDRAKNIVCAFNEKAQSVRKKIVNLQEIILAPITCTLTLIELMKVKLELWEGLTKKLIEQGVLNKGHVEEVVFVKTIVGAPIEFNKVNGIQGENEGNTTLGIKYEGI